MDRPDEQGLAPGIDRHESRSLLANDLEKGTAL
jgi:hypothetical protein